jgi:16S rRNA (cytosine967-C5)-methyltransferase
MKISPARRAALEILNRIDDDRAFSSVLLPRFEEALDDNDRGLCHELVLGVLRRRMYLDRVIEHYAGPKKLDTAVRNALRLGAYQIICLNKVPTYSAINESVNLVQAARKTSAKGLVNAVLRRVSEKVPTLEFEDDVERISVETSHPRWLIEKWVGDFGQADAAVTAAANNTIPRAAFRRSSSGPTSDLSAYQSSAIVDGAYIASSIDAPLRRLADDNKIYFQDEASQLVASVVLRTEGKRILDVCAAPGGKTTLIAGNIGHVSGRLIVAGDLHDSRVELLRSTCVRQGVGFVKVLRYNAEMSLPFADESFDTVLVDAPCSGTGTIRHNPEIRYFLDPTDFGALAAKQRTILKNASKLVCVGGSLIYSTCSIQPEENESVAAGFIQESSGFVSRKPDVPDRLVTSDGFARTFPHRDGTDGFFIAEFQRVD